jgi:NAD(P)-dependent dehydrogenase (short-subunit alcohol dehydrogenase family)
MARLKKHIYPNNIGEFVISLKDDGRDVRPSKARLDGKVAVITGAGNGIGFTMTEVFVAEGARVIAADIRMDALAKWEGVAGVDSIVTDITKEKDVNRLIEMAEEQHGRLDILCNVAAHYCDKGIRCVAICPGGVKTDIEKHSGGTFISVVGKSW